jgi:hypothetical protein
MRPFAVLLLCSAAACASSVGRATRPTQTVRVVAQNGGTNAVEIAPSNTTVRSSIRAPLEEVWRSLPGAYDSLGIALTTRDATRHFIGNEGMKIRTRLGGVALSHYIDCGRAQIGPSADSYDIFLAVTTVAQAVSPTETRLYTTVQASGKPMNFGQDYSHCTSTNELEKRIAALVTNAVTKQH